MKKTYSEKLKDPRWQKKRLLILERDDWKCRDCGKSDDTLHVHHIYYEKGKEPWEARDESLLTLCEVCHKSDHKHRSFFEQTLVEITRERGFTLSDLINLVILCDTQKASFIMPQDWEHFNNKVNGKKSDTSALLQ